VFMTTLLNAFTAPFLVQKLGIIALPEARQTLLRLFYQQLVNYSHYNDNPEEVTAALKEMLHEAAEEIEHQQTSKTGPRCTRHADAEGNCLLTPKLHQNREDAEGAMPETHFVGMPSQLWTGGPSCPRPAGMQDGCVDGNIGTDGDLRLSGLSIDSAVIDSSVIASHMDSSLTSTQFQANDEMLHELKVLRHKYKKIPQDELRLLGDELPENLLDSDDVDNMMALIEHQDVDVGMAKVANECFLNMVYNNYWRLIGEGKLRPGSPESDVLLTSIRVSQSPYRADLIDFRYLFDRMVGKNETNVDDILGTEFDALEVPIPSGVPMDSKLSLTVGSWQFKAFIAVAIMFNSIVVCIEELSHGDDNEVNPAWLVLDAVFTSIFLVEFCLKFLWLKCAYYKDPWNRFDFFLVIAGVFGLVVSIVTRGSNSDLADQSKLLRLARVLRSMRLLRILRIFHAQMSKDKLVSIELSRMLKKITAMSCFIKAHLMAQNDMVKFFGGNGRGTQASEAEIARCVLQSQTVTYKALIIASRAQKQMDQEVLHELQTVYQRKCIAEGLSVFVENAVADGAISEKEAHAILHPLNHQIAECMGMLNDRAEGVITTSPSQNEDSKSGGSGGRSTHMVKSRDSSADSWMSSDACSSAPHSQGSLTSSVGLPGEDSAKLDDTEIVATSDKHISGFCIAAAPEAAPCAPDVSAADSTAALCGQLPGVPLTP